MSRHESQDKQEDKQTMTLTEKIIEILNRDTRLLPALTALNQKAIEYKLTLEQYQKAREIVLLSLMKDNKEIVDAYWEEFGLLQWNAAHPGEI